MCVVLFVVWRLLSVVVVRCSLFVARCVSAVVWCLLFDGLRLLLVFVVRCLLFVVCRLLFVDDC